jgi:predicted GNAT family N-acyltransferase
VRLRVEPVPAEVTLPLRQRVLRPHQTIEQVRLPGDDDRDTRHFAALDEAGAVVGVASVRREPAPWGPDGWRLRGMATAEQWRGRGVGANVLAAVFDHVAARGGGLVWCNARVPALRFYERAGFVVRGEPWDEPDIGPHVRMWREVGRAG